MLNLEDSLQSTSKKCFLKKLRNKYEWIKGMGLTPTPSSIQHSNTSKNYGHKYSEQEKGLEQGPIQVQGRAQVRIQAQRQSTKTMTSTSTRTSDKTQGRAQGQVTKDKGQPPKGTSGGSCILEGTTRSYNQRISDSPLALGEWGFLSPGTPLKVKK